MNSSMHDLDADALSYLLDSGVNSGSGGGGNCIGDDLMGISSVSSQLISLLDHSVLIGQGGGGNSIGDDSAGSVC